jgi:AcrR family transcriptional regulator
MPTKRTPPAAATSRPLRGRPPSIDWEKLLEVAREVFLERGIRATTLEVAERAGVSEGAIFHRFKSKDGLFHEAMHFDADKVPERLARALEGLDELDIHEALLRMASSIMGIAREVMPLMMMTWSNPDHAGCIGSDGLRAGFRALLKRFASYFESRMDAGDLRRMDGELLARVFIGAIHHYRLTQLAVTAGHDAMPEGMFIRGLVDLFLTGAAPASATRPRDPLIRS